MPIDISGIIGLQSAQMTKMQPRAMKGRGCL
jgi:hypothetical protein